MDKKALVFLFAFAFIIATQIAGATVDSINYPLDNDVLSYSSRIPLDVTSTGSSGCYFYYETHKGYVYVNSSVSCNGETLVDLPNSNGNYTIYVEDNATSIQSVDVEVAKEGNFLLALFYAVFVFILISVITSIVTTIARLITFKYTPLELGISFGLYFVVLFLNWASIEYVRIPLITTFTDNFVAWLAFPLIILPTIALILSLIFGKGKEVEQQIKPKGTFGYG